MSSEGLQKIQKEKCFRSIESHRYFLILSMISTSTTIYHVQIRKILPKLLTMLAHLTAFRMNVVSSNESAILDKLDEEDSDFIVYVI